MPRISCRVPNDVPIRGEIVNLGTSWTTLLEAPDYTVPDEGLRYAQRDPLNTTGRGIVPGEIFLLQPVEARNKTDTERWIEARILGESGVAIILARVWVPPNETRAVTRPALSLFKLVAANANGDRLQLRAEAANVFDVVVPASRQPLQQDEREVTL